MKYNFDSVAIILKQHIKDKQYYIDLFNGWLADPNHVWDKSKGLIGYNRSTKNGIKQAIWEYKYEIEIFEKAISILKDNEDL